MATADTRGRKNIVPCSLTSDEVYDLVCIPCHRDDSTIPAFGYCIDCLEHLCHNCYKLHKIATPCKHHELQDKDAMPSVQQLTGVHVHDGPTDKLTTPCLRHKTEMIKLYCHDHDMLLCNLCVAQEHTKPCHVYYIPEISGQMINSRVYKDTMNRIDKLLMKCPRVKNEILRDNNKSNDSLKDALLDVGKYRQNINKRMDELEQEIEDRIRAQQHQNDDQIKAVETTCEDVTKILKVTYSHMNQLNASNQADTLFTEVIQAQKLLQDCEHKMISLSTEDRTGEYEFIPNKAIIDVFQDEKMIGILSTKHQEMTGSSSHSTSSETSAHDNITLSYSSEVYCKSPEDGDRCNITGIAVLPADRLVLTDWNNKSIKLVDVKSKCITSRLSLGRGDEDRPFGITSVTTTKVAVTLPNRQRIQFISGSNKLKLKHKIKTDGNCFGICCHKNKLIVTYKYPGNLDILDIKGTLINRVKTEIICEDVINQTDTVQASSSFIYVNDANSIVLLNWQGELSDRLGNFEDPVSFALLGDGSVIVCDFNSDTVCQVSRDTCSIVLQDLKCPNAVCVDDGRRKLYISRRTNHKDRMDDNIVVYDI